MRPTRRTWKRAGSALLLLTCAAVAAQAAPPAAPEQVSYQGLLLDGSGAPRTGSVDLTLRIWDALSGGTLVYKQVFPATPLTDGVFTLTLGPTGAASDVPADPLTTSLGDALAADLGPSGASRYLEVTVGSEGALARTQILTVPYALHAQTADQAALADLATSATTAGDASSVGGLDATFVTQLYEHSNFDGEAPPNTHPDEGLADVDGDGASNFIDPDNDDDGVSDASEFSNGTGLNLVTPTLTGFVPPTGDSGRSQTVTVQGTNFEPGIAVAFGTQTPAPSSVTPTSLEVVVGPQAVGPASVVLTRTNGESASGSFQFLEVVPTLTQLSPPIGSLVDPTVVTLSGTNFQPDMNVAFGSESPTPTSVTPTSAQVTVGPQSGIVPVVVTLVNGSSSGVAAFPFGSPAHPVAPGGQLTLGVKGLQQTVLGTEVQYGVDTDADRIPELLLPFTSNSQATKGQIAVSWDPSGRVAGVRCRPGGAQCTVELASDSDADFELEDETGALIETVTGIARIEAPSLAWDASGHAVVGYLRRTLAASVDPVVARDLDGDGQFTGAGEVAVFGASTGSSTKHGEVAVNAAGGVAYAHREGTASLRVRHDPEGDGSYLFAQRSTGTLVCMGAAYDAGGTLFVAYGSSANVVLWNVTADTTQVLASGAAAACDVVGGAGVGLAVAYANASSGLRLLVDRDANGSLESNVLLENPSTASAVELRRGSDGRVIAATNDRVLIDPISP
jgi:hypothetical protein